jgi:membrane protein required for colicin V production
MNWLDVVIIAMIAWFTFTAFTTGILREVVTVVAVLVAALVAGLLYQNLANDILVFIENERAAHLTAFLSIFVSLTLAGQLVGHMLKGTAELLMLGWVDHLAGAAFGLLKGLVVAEIFFIVFVTYQVAALEDAIDGSLVAPFFLETVPVLLQILPGEFESGVELWQG